MTDHNNPLATLKVWPKTKLLLDVSAALYGKTKVELLHEMVEKYLKDHRILADTEAIIADVHEIEG
ncbi:MAG: hypothetical protein KDD28_28040 [Phaeodactylibacter sp.]|nr:hypothetical protein [Phaeodactylibacter sp.]